MGHPETIKIAIIKKFPKLLRIYGNVLRRFPGMNGLTLMIYFSFQWARPTRFCSMPRWISEDERKEGKNLDEPRHQYIIDRNI